MIKKSYLVVVIVSAIFFSRSYADSNINLSKQLLSDYQTKNEDQFLKDFPSNYKEFINLFGFNLSNQDNKNLYEKSHDLIEFFFTIKRPGVKEEVTIKIFSIAKDAIWEADAVNHFQHGLREVIKKKPDYLCELLQGRQTLDALNFSKFYFSGLYPSKTMPDELLILQNKCPVAYESMISGFVYSLIQHNNPITPENFTINDFDGRTNLRAGPNITSKIIGTISNTTRVSSVYKKGSWLFIRNSFDNTYGYINIKNVRIEKKHFKEDLPFVGSKIMGSPLGHMFSTIITIQLSGNTIIRNCGESLADNGCSIVYQGVYSTPLIVDKNNQEGYFFKSNAVYDYLNGHIGEKLNFENGDSW